MPKTWVKTIDGKYLLWAEKDSLQYSWKGGSFDQFVNGKGTLSIYKSGVLVDKIEFTDEELPFLGAIKSEDIFSIENKENDKDDRYVGQTLNNSFHGTGILLKSNGDIYSGQFQNGKPDGALTRYQKGKISYQGSWENGLPNGIGTLYLKSGEKIYGFWENGQISKKIDSKAILPEGEYFGRMDNGVANGLGKMKYSDGSVFQGCWKNGKYDGFGCLIGTHKDTIIGEFKNGLMHGYAELSSPLGEYYGGWKSGKKSGAGSFFYADGSVYDGSWSENKKEGLGEIFISNGDSYDGYWENNKRNGYGNYYFKNGNTYSGEWKDNFQHGYGVLESNDLKYNGEWIKGVVSGYGEILYKENGDTYKGDFKDNIKSGTGAYYFKNGNKYEGEFKKDLFSGNGVFTFKDGNVYQGEFYNAKMFGYGTLYLKEGKNTIAITANWDGTNKFPPKASILFSNGDLYEGPLVNGFPTSKGHWTTEKERLNPKPIVLNEKSLTERANSFYKTHKETINYVKDQTQNVLLVAAIAASILVTAPEVATIASVAGYTYGVAVAAQFTSKMKDSYDFHESGDNVKAKKIFYEALQDVAFDAAILVGGKALKNLPLKTMSKPLLVSGKTFAKRFELVLTKNGTFQKIAVQAKKIIEIPKFIYNRKTTGGFDNQTLSKKKALDYFYDKTKRVMQNLYQDKSGSVLSENLEKAGVKYIKGTQAHHIIGVDSKCASTIALNELLDKFGVDINDAINGIRLPGGHKNEGVNPTRAYKTTSARGQIHQGSHNCEYYDQVYRILKGVESSQDFLGKMHIIKKKIYNGDILLNGVRMKNTVFGTKRIKR